MKRIRFSSFEIIAFDFISLNCVSRNDTFLSNSFLICGFHQCSLMTLASISKPSCLSHRYLIKHGLSVGGFQSLFPKSSGKPVIKNNYSILIQFCMYNFKVDPKICYFDHLPSNEGFNRSFRPPINALA